jgi:hypothetical protein
MTLFPVFCGYLKIFKKGQFWFFLIISSENHCFQFFGGKKAIIQESPVPITSKQINVSVGLMKEQIWKLRKTELNHVLYM